LELCFGYIKDKARRRWVFEKSTELGIDSVRVLSTDFSSSSDSNYKNKQQRNVWDAEDCEKHFKHVIEAAEQSEQLSVPSIEEKSWSVDELLEAIDNNTSESDNHLWLVCRERSATSPPILQVLADSKQTTSIHILIGPEGGWSPRELNLLANNEKIQFVSLGSSVLRAETAAIAAVAAVQMHRETML